MHFIGLWFMGRINRNKSIDFFIISYYLCVFCYVILFLDLSNCNLNELLLDILYELSRKSRTNLIIRLIYNY